MNWFEPIDHYCERLGPGFWAEPLNAFSNLSFLIAGAMLLMQWQRSPVRPITVLLLIANVLAIGIGSFLFHTFANRWSELADTLPITIFIHFYLLLALRVYLGFAWWQAAVATLAFFLAAPLIGNALRPFAGTSAFYIPALLAIFAVGLAAGRKPGIALMLFITGGVFALSIIYRAMDLPMCEAHPQGTHARWHLLNGVVLYLLVRLYLKATAARRYQALKSLIDAHINTHGT